MSVEAPASTASSVEVDAAEPAPGGRARARIVAALGAAWTATMGLAPHVLHHVGPLAGAAFVAGTTGTVLFGMAALVLTVPLLLRVRRRAGSWRLPALLLGAFVAVWLASTFVVGPLVRDQLADDPAPAGLVAEPADGEDHEQHHG